MPGPCWCQHIHMHAHCPPSQNSKTLAPYKTLSSSSFSLHRTSSSLRMAASSNKALASTTALLLSLNLLFFSLVSCNSAPCPPEPTKPQPQPTPKPHPTPKPPHHGSCPRDTLKLGACADVLGGFININIGKPPKTPCCSFLQGLADVEAAACLCTAIKANVLGRNLNVPVSLSLLLNYCGKKVPEGYKCA